MRRLSLALLAVGACVVPEMAAAREVPRRETLAFLSEAEPLPAAELAAQSGGHAVAVRRSTPAEQASVTLWDELRRAGGRPPRHDGGMVLDGRISR
jgi:hypothetical protein